MSHAWQAMPETIRDLVYGNATPPSPCDHIPTVKLMPSDARRCPCGRVRIGHLEMVACATTLAFADLIRARLTATVAGNGDDVIQTKGGKLTFGDNPTYPKTKMSTTTITDLTSKMAIDWEADFRPVPRRDRLGRDIAAYGAKPKSAPEQTPKPGVRRIDLDD